MEKTSDMPTQMSIDPGFRLHGKRHLLANCPRSDDEPLDGTRGIWRTGGGHQLQNVSLG